MKSTSQTQSTLQAGKIVGFSILVGLSSLTFFGRSALAGSQPLQISSIPVTSAANTVPDLLIVRAKNRSLPKNTVLVSPATNGGGSFRVSNCTNRDAYIKLVEQRYRELVAAFYVKSNSSFTLEPIPNGAYQVLFVSGTDCNAKTSSFTKSKKFAKFNKYLNFMTMRVGNEIQYRAFTITLNPVIDGNATTSRVNEQEFANY